LRVVTLLPAATELLCAIPGGADLLVGRSHECDYPPSVQRLPALTASRLPHDLRAAEIDAAVRETLQPDSGPGSLYTLNADLLAALRPDLLITQDICHVCSIDPNAVRSIVSRLADPKPEILTLSASSFEGMLDDLLAVGRAIGLEQAASGAIVALAARMNAAQGFVNAYAEGPRVAVLDWTDPLYIAGHWTPQLVERAGALHPLNPTRAPEDAGAAVGLQQSSRRAGPSIPITTEQLIASGPEAIVLAPCGVPLAGASPLTVRALAADLSKRPWWRDLPAVRAGRVALVDGNQMFSRPGPRLVEAFEWLVGWLNDRPGAIPHGFPWQPL